MTQKLEQLKRIVEDEYKTSRKMSLYEFIGTAAGKELGMEVWSAANKVGIKKETREVDSGNYKGKVNIYPELFLKAYFIVNRPVFFEEDRG